MAGIPKLPSPEDDDPLLRRVLYQGEGSATADKEALAEAKRRIAAGDDAGQVWTDLGWKQGAGGEWRSEIDDSKSKLRPGIAQKLLELQAQQQANAANAPIAAAGRHFLGPLVKAGTFGLVDPNAIEPSHKLGDLIDHPELAKAYPAVMETPVAIDASLRNLGEFQAGKTLVLNPRFIQLMADRRQVPYEDFLREVVLHETQHGIQHGEKWKAQHPEDAHDPYRARTEEAEAFDAELRRDLSAEERRQIQPGTLDAIDRERVLNRFREVPSSKRSPAEAPPEPLLPPGVDVPMRQPDPNEGPSPSGAEDAGRPGAAASQLREIYAAGHGFGSYLDMHFALLHPSTPPDIVEHHLRELQAANKVDDGGGTRHLLGLRDVGTTDGATEDGEPAP